MHGISDTIWGKKKKNRQVYLLLVALDKKHLLNALNANVKFFDSLYSLYSLQTSTIENFHML